MKAFRYFTAVAALLSLAACNNDEWNGSDYNNDPNAVQIIATVGHTLTRSNPTEEIGSEKATQFKVGDKISVSTEDQSAAIYVLEADNSWKPVDPNAYLVWNKSIHTFTAHYPAGEYTGYETTRVIQDSEEDIAKADYMSFSGEFSKTGSIIFEMERRTARVVIDEAQFSWGNQYMEGNNAAYEVKGIQVHAGDASGISPYKVGTKYYALVNPGAEKADAPFITLKVGPKQGYSGTEEELIIRGIPELIANTSYNLQITIGKDKAELGKVTLEDWGTSENPWSGEASNGYIKYDGFGYTGYDIYTAEGLLEVNKILTADAATRTLSVNITLYNDITLPAVTGNESNWTPLGTESVPFDGNFFGNGKTIKGLVIRNPDAGYQGLIGHASCSISNLTLEGCTVIGGNYVGGIVGCKTAGNMENCHIIATSQYPVTIESTGTHVGGVIGDNSNGAISGCTIVCQDGGSIAIKGTLAVGGFAGRNMYVDTSKLSKCEVINNGGSFTVTNTGPYTGGFVGINEDAINDCKVSGVSVTGTMYVGGFVGQVIYESTITGTNTVRNCTITGNDGSTRADYGIIDDNQNTINIDADSSNTVIKN